MRIARATFTVLTLTLSACGGSGSTAPGGNGGPSPSLSIAIADPLAVGTSLQATATITDINGNSAPATNVGWSSLDPSVLSVDASGLVTGKLVGMGAIRATSGALSKDRVVIVKPGPPAKVTIYAGDNQVANRGASVSDPLCVLVVDAFGNVIPGEAVYYTVTTGGGSIQTPTAPTTDGSGVAISGIWHLGSLAGVQNVRAATSNGLSVTFKATAQ